MCQELLYQKPPTAFSFMLLPVFVPDVSRSTLAELHEVYVEFCTDVYPIFLYFTSVGLQNLDDEFQRVKQLLSTVFACLISNLI